MLLKISEPEILNISLKDGRSTTLKAQELSVRKSTTALLRSFCVAAFEVGNSNLDCLDVTFTDDDRCSLLFFWFIMLFQMITCQYFQTEAPEDILKL